MLSSSTADNLKLHLLLEQAQDGSAITTVLELPDCRIEVPTNQQAIAQIENRLNFLSHFSD